MSQNQNVIETEIERVHPARLTIEEVRADNYQSYHNLIRSGVRSPYALAPDDIHIPTTSIKGRLPTTTEYGVSKPNAFTAYINHDTGILRLDNMDCAPFWLEIHLADVAKK